MDGLCRCLATAVGVELATSTSGGMATYLLEPMTLGVIASFEAWLLCQRGDPLSWVLTSLEQVEEKYEVPGQLAGQGAGGGAGSPPGWATLTGQLTERALEELRTDKGLRVIAVQDVQEQLQTLDGLAYTCWLGLRNSGHPDFLTLEGSREHLLRQSRSQVRSLLRARDLASGCDHLAALDWPTSQAEQQGKTGKVKYIPWRRILRHFLEFGIGPSEVARLTLYSLRTLTAPEEMLGGSRRVEGTGEALRFAQERRLVRQLGGGS